MNVIRSSFLYSTAAADAEFTNKNSSLHRAYLSFRSMSDFTQAQYYIFSLGAVSFIMTIWQ